MSGNRAGYRPGAPIPYRPDQPPQKRYGFHPAQYHKAQANDVYLQYQKQVSDVQTFVNFMVLQSGFIFPAVQFSMTIC